VVDLDLPPATSGVDELPRHLVDLHQAGFFRAIGSAVDCLGAAVVGVAGLPTNMRTDIGKAKAAAGRLGNDSPLGGRIVGLLTDAEAEAGPAGWLLWATEYRNMLVHRARRLELSQFVRRRPLLGPNSNPIVRVDTVEQLAQDPGRSDIEAMLAMAWGPAKAAGEKVAPVLEEAASTTIDGIFVSTSGYLDAVADGLVAIWEERRTSPDLVLQPAAQWPVVPSTEPNEFDGYARGTLSYTPDSLVGHPTLFTRMTAALMADDYATTWDNLD
jgi:hypothetical protein